MSTKVARKGLAFTADAELVQAALSRVAKAASARNSIEILKGAHLSVEDGKLVMWSTDMSSAFREKIEVGKGTGDPCVVLAPDLIQTLKTMEGDLRFKVKLRDQKLEVSDTEGTSILFDLAHTEDFPKHPLDMPDVRTNEGFVVHRKAFMDMYARLIPCASKDESRPVLTAVSLERHENTLVGCATDSYRLAVDCCGTGPGEFLNMLVPARDLTRALAFVGGEAFRLAQRIEQVGNDDVAKWLIVSNGGREACIRNVDGAFPDWRRLIPERYEATAIIAQALLAKAVGRIAKLSKHNVPVRLQPLDGKLQVIFEGYDQLSIRSQIDVTLSGEWNNTFGANAGFLAEGIEGFDTPRVQLNVIHHLRPMLITEEGWSPGKALEPKRLYMIMPIRLPEA